MHELAVMAEAVRIASESARTAGMHRVTSLRLRVGSLSGVVPEAMEFAWEIVRCDTPLAQATLQIELVPAACWCAVCEKEFECADYSNECPRCRNRGGELRRGRELEIAALEGIDHV